MGSRCQLSEYRKLYKICKTKQSSGSHAESRRPQSHSIVQQWRFSQLSALVRHQHFCPYRRHADDHLPLQWGADPDHQQSRSPIRFGFAGADLRDCPSRDTTLAENYQSIWNRCRAQRTNRLRRLPTGGGIRYRERTNHRQRNHIFCPASVLF